MKYNGCIILSIYLFLFHVLLCDLITFSILGHNISSVFMIHKTV